VGGPICWRVWKGFTVLTLLKRLLSLLAIGAIIAGVVYVVNQPGTHEKAAKNRAKGGDGPVPVLAATARKSDVPVYLNGVGAAKARNTVTVRAQVDGRVVSINFKEGQDVKRGDVLAKIDPATYEAQLEQAVAKKAVDEAQLENAKRDLERYSKLTSLSVAEKTIDTQRALVVQLTAQIKLDDAAIANAKAFLDYTTILSPLDGRTGIRMVDEGNLVRAIDTNSGIVVITELKPISVIFTLPQQQLGQINQALTRGTVSVDALDADNKTVLDTGVLQVVDNQVDPTTGTIRLKCEFPNTNLQLWPGQFVNVRVRTDILNQVVVVPTPAVQRGPNGAFVYVVQGDETVVLHNVSLTSQDENQAIVSRGVAAGDRVVTTGFARLKDGSRVTVADPEEMTSSASDNKRGKSPGREARAGNVRVACAADVQKFCANVERNLVRACLQTNAEQLSDACKIAAAGAKAEARKADTGSTQ
jgi:membrane fusion protein, multidrug efflux system